MHDQHEQELDAISQEEPSDETPPSENETHESSLENHQDSEKSKDHQKNLEEFQAAFQGLSDVEEKLRLAIQFMRSSLSQGITPYFKGFWEARQLCLPLFKENLAPSSRIELWKEYRELCSESHRLKQLLEEQSAFAVEQIDLAIQSLEQEIESLDAKLQNLPSIDFAVSSQALEVHFDEYQALQKELFLLNTYATRINALRKELIKTEMRIRQKNKFFRRLSAMGDNVFPRRKELIKQVSALFLEDVDAFIKNHFSQDVLRQPLFFYRDEIKALQGVAKALTLNTHAFTHTRAELSACWDRVKEIDKERKKVRAEQKVVFQQNVQQIVEQIDAMSHAYAAGELSIQNASKAVDDIFSAMQQLELGRDEKRHLRERLSEARQPILAKMREEETARFEKEQSAEREKREKIKALKERIQALISDADHLSVEEVISKKDELAEDIKAAPLNKIEKQSMEKLLKPLKDLISDKKERAVLSLSAQDQETLEQLKQVLRQRKERRKEAKAQLEELRKAAGSSGLNFEKAMAYNEQVQEERERLEKIDLAIEEIEEKIAQLEG